MNNESSSEDILPIKMQSSDAIIEEESNTANLEGSKPKQTDEIEKEKEEKSYDYEQLRSENKPNDEYQDDYNEEEEGEDINNNRNINEGNDNNNADAQQEQEQEYEGDGEEEYNQENINNEMEAISEAEIEEDQKFQRTNMEQQQHKQQQHHHHPNVLIKDDYNQASNAIDSHSNSNNNPNPKQYYIIKEDSNKNQFKPLTMMKRKDPFDYNNNNKVYTSTKQKCYLQNSAKSINTTSGNNHPKIPIEFTLYDEAAKRKEKIEKVEYNNMMKIILTSSKAKISNNSQRIAICKVEKKIEEVVSKRERNKHLTFINIGEILTELNIFREILPKSNNTNTNDNAQHNRQPSSSSSSMKKNPTYQSYKDIQKEMINIKENEKRKQSEINFYEQFWLMINPGNKQEIKADMISEILKILFAPINANVKDITEILKQFLMTAFFLNCNPEEVKKYISPITDKEIPEEDIWPIEKVVKEFSLLKENILAYQHLKHLNKAINNDIAKAEKEISFKPSIIGFWNDEEKNKKWNYFEQRLPALVERERLRQQVLEEMKKETEEADLKECTFKPDINLSQGRLKKGTKNANVNTKSNNEDIYERLHTSNKDKDQRRKQEKEELTKSEETKAMAECSFKPKLISKETYQQSFANSEYPKGFQEYVTKMQNGIIEAQKKKFNERRIPVGENYEKVKQANIQPFNITDLNRKKEDNKKEGKGDKEKENYFTIQVKIPSGKERTLKIFLNDDPYEIADNFCKTYCFKEEINERLAKTIISFRTIYMQRNHIEANN